MSFLENRVPPPLVLLFTVILMTALARLDTRNLLQLAPPILNGILCILLMASGCVIAVLGVREFRRYQTTVNPLRPERASSLVKSGIFAITRNPMYLGMLLITLGVAAYLASLWSLIGTLLFFFYISRFQIVPEERAMRAMFDKEFHAYCDSTRRWI